MDVIELQMRATYDGVAELEKKLDDLQNKSEKAQTGLKKTGDATDAVGKAADKAKAQLGEFTNHILGVEKAGGKVSSTLKDVASSFNPATLAATAFASVMGALTLGALKSMVEGVVHARAEIWQLHENTGIAVETLSGLKTIADYTGTSMESVADLTKKFNAAVATSDRATSIQAEAFKNLGIELKDSNGHFKDTITLQQEAARTLNDHKDGIEKDAYYMALWGKQAVNNKEYLRTLGEQQSIHGKLTREQAEQADRLEKQMRQLSKATGEFKQSLANELVPWLLEATSKINDLLKAAGSLRVAFKNADLFGDYGNDLKTKLDEVEGQIKTRTTAWNNMASWGRGSEENFKAGIKALEERRNAIKRLMDAETERAARARSDFAQHDPRLLGDPNDLKPTLKNIKDKEVPGGSGPSVAENPAHNELLRQEDELIKLRAEYEKFFGIQSQTNAQMVEAAIAAGKYNEKINEKGELVRKAATAEELTQMRSNAAAADYLKNVNERTKADKQAWENAERQVKTELDKATSLRQQTAESKIAQRVMREYGKTQDDVNIAVTAYNIQLAETALAIAKATGATEQEVYVLQSKLDALKDIKVIQQDTKDDNDSERARQKTFEYGWSDAFKRYKDEAGNAANTARTLFDTATRGMEDAFVKFATTGKLSFRDLASSIISDLARIAAKKAAVAIMEGIGSMFGFANGGAFDGGVQKFASGGSFSNGVVSSPTYFNMGLMGEAGPEAIMPLTRTPNGKLGVQTTGSGGGGQTVTISIGDVIVQGGETNDETAARLHKQMVQTMTQIADGRIMNARRSGGLLNR
jgi:lambda family phage tail tape measure protein